MSSRASSEAEQVMRSLEARVSANSGACGARTEAPFASFRRSYLTKTLTREPGRRVPLRGVDTHRRDERPSRRRGPESEKPLNGGKRRSMASRDDSFRVNRTQEVAGSSPTSCTKKRPARRAFSVSACWMETYKHGPWSSFGQARIESAGRPLTSPLQEVRGRGNASAS